MDHEGDFPQWACWWVIGAWLIVMVVAAATFG